MQSFLCHRANGVNLKMEAVSSKSLFNKNKHWICQINLVFIHPTNNSSWFCRDIITIIILQVVVKFVYRKCHSLDFNGNILLTEC